MRGKLTLEKIRTSNNWPKLKGKGAGVRSLSPFLLEQAELYLSERHVLLCRMLCRFYHILANEDRFLSDDAKHELPRLGRSLCNMYAVFAAEAVATLARTWKATPKVHIFLHLCELQAVQYGNPRFYWVYADEDIVGKIVTVAESCHPRTMPLIAMWKWLTAAYEDMD